MSRSPFSPLTIVEERDLALWLMEFFRGGKRIEGVGVTPFSMADAVGALPESPELSHVKAYWPVGHFERMVQRLAEAGFLSFVGFSGSGFPPRNHCYYSLPFVSRYQAGGHAWLTPVLGWEHLIDVASPQICRLLGTNPAGDERLGSGLLLKSGQVLTNKHVVEDMTLRSVVVADKEIEVASVRAHTATDVALVYLKEAVQAANAGLAFRDYRSVEPILILGYPPVPFARSSPMIAQTGETCGATVEHLDGPRQLLITAIARPGNSGGPVFARDGRIVGLVSRSLERLSEQGEGAPPMPFYAAVPAAEVRQAVGDLDSDLEFPWETWTNERDP